MPNGSSEEDRARARYRDKMRNIGKPMQVTDAEYNQARNLVLRARKAGMDDMSISRQIGLLGNNTIWKIRTGYTKTMLRSTFEKIMTLRPEEYRARPHPSRTKIPAGALVPPHGTQRRIQALRADGFGGPILGDMLGVTLEAVSDLARRPRKGVFLTTYTEVKELYEKLEDASPADYGVSSSSVKRSKGYAAKRLWAPRSCWDVDTIDDPTAIPEWTGKCGTVFGWRIHETRGIPLCLPCVAARESSDLRLSGEKLRKARIRRGLTQEMLARDAGIKSDQYRSWEWGRTQPRYQEDLDRVLTVLDVTYDQVVE